jgi:hypothetical protein
MLTVPVVDCPKQVAAEIARKIVSSASLVGEWGMVLILEAGVRHGLPAVSL